MEKNEEIELNGIQYKLVLNRKSFIEIDKICDIEKSMRIINEPLIEHLEEIDDSYVPNLEDDDKLENEIQSKIDKKLDTLKRVLERAFLIWLYPNHKLTISQVKEIIKPYISDDEEKSNYIGSKLAHLLNECISMRESEIKEKNFKALANK